MGRTNQESQTAIIGDEGGGDWQDGLEALDSPQGDQVIGARGQGFSSDILYIDVRQCKGADHFAEECGLLVVRLDQCERDVWRPKFDREAGESRARAYVGNLQ